MSSLKFPDYPPAYEEVPDNNINASQSYSPPIYQTPQSTTLTCKRTDCGSSEAEPSYHELSAPPSDKVIERTPGYDSLGHHSLRVDCSGNDEQVYDELNVTTQTHPTNSQQQDYDHLHGNTVRVPTQQRT